MFSHAAVTGNRDAAVSETSSRDGTMDACSSDGTAERAADECDDDQAVGMANMPRSPPCSMIAARALSGQRLRGTED
jgi:hypothetical protein